MKRRMAALLAVMGLFAATVPATAGAERKKPRCGGEHYLKIPFTQTSVPFPYC
jgi:hypothetical protein